MTDTTAFTVEKKVELIQYLTEMRGGCIIIQECGTITRDVLNVFNEDELAVMFTSFFLNVAERVTEKESS